MDDQQPRFSDEDLELFPSGGVREGLLVESAVIQGFPCLRERTVGFYEDGALRFATAAKAFRVERICCAPGKIFYLHESGELLNAALEEELVTGPLRVGKGCRATFDEDGRLIEHSRALEQDQTIQGWPVSALFDVWFHAGGGPSLLVLSRPHAFAGETFPKWTELSLDPDGQVIDAVRLEVEPGQGYKQRVCGLFPVPWD